jgi:hypothetical protein
MLTVRCSVAAGVIGLATALAAIAQQPVVAPNGTAAPAPAPVAAPGFNGAMGINAGIFVALAGAALYAVCRGSRRV